MIRQGRLTAVVWTFLIGCVVLLVVGCAGTSSETSNKKEQGSSPQATDSEEARCGGTRTSHIYMVVYANGQNGPYRTGSEEDMKKAGKTQDFGLYTTNDLPGCPKGGLLSGTDKPDWLDGKHGDDELHGLGGSDLYLEGGPGSDILYGGDGNDVLADNELHANDGQRDKLYCGEGQDEYTAGKNDYVDSSCERMGILGGGA